jgi:hypothetical protein
MASSREPANLAEIERAAVKAIRDDPDRTWDWIQFGPTPLPATTTTQRRATNPGRGPGDAAELENVKKIVFLSASWRACKPERVKGGQTRPADEPTLFRTEREALETLDRYRRIGSEAGVPMSAHLQYAVVAPAREWEATAGQPTADREREQIQAEVRLETLEVQAREAAEALERARTEQERATPDAAGRSDWHKHPTEPQVQQRIRSDHSKVFRCRVGGRTSPTFDSVAEAVLSRDRLNEQLAAGAEA